MSQSEITLASLQAIFSDPKLSRKAKDNLFGILRAIGYGLMSAHVRADTFVEEVFLADSLDKLENRWIEIFRPKARQIEGCLARYGKFERTPVEDYFCNRILKRCAVGE